MVDALAFALRGVEVLWVGSNVWALFWGALALARLNVEEFRAVLFACLESVLASALAGGWVPVVTFSAFFWPAVAAAS